MNRYFAKRPGGAAYEYTEDELIAAFDRGEVDGWVARRSDLPDWVPVEDIFAAPVPRARRVSTPRRTAPSMADTAADLQRLHDLKTSGAIDEAEYAALKQAVIARATAPAQEPEDDDPSPDYDPDDYRPNRRTAPLEPHRGGLILTLGVVSLIPALCFLGLFAMSMGQHDLHRMREGYMDRDGEGQTRVGFVLGAITSSLLFLGCLFGGYVVIAGR
jgi:hypothetical protein